MRKTLLTKFISVVIAFTFLGLFILLPSSQVMGSSQSLIQHIKINFGILLTKIYPWISFSNDSLSKCICLFLSSLIVCHIFTNSDLFAVSASSYGMGLMHTPDVTNYCAAVASLDELVTFTVNPFDMEVPLDFISTTPLTTSRTRQVILAVSSFSPSSISW